MSNHINNETKLDLEKTIITLQEELTRFKSKPEGKIAYVFLAIGIIFLGLSYVHNHSILAYIGIALTLWGAILLYVKPINFVRTDILDSSIINLYENIERILEQLQYSGTPFYISPGTLNSIHKVILYLPKRDSNIFPSDTELTDQNIVMQDPLAIKLLPSGLQLFLTMEKELGIFFSSVNMDYLRNNLGEVVVKKLMLAESLELEVKNEIVEVTIVESIFDKILIQSLSLNQIQIIRDPLTSAIACIISSISRYPVTIKSVTRDDDLPVVKIIYEILI